MHNRRMLTGEELKKARDSLGETQQQFCGRLGIDQTTLSRWETQGPPVQGPARIVIQRVLNEIGQSE